MVKAFIRGYTISSSFLFNQNTKKLNNNFFYSVEQKDERRKREMGLKLAIPEQTVENQVIE
jgi:hypothetical protein